MRAPSKTTAPSRFFTTRSLSAQRFSARLSDVAIVRQHSHKLARGAGRLLGSGEELPDGGDDEPVVFDLRQS